MYTYRNVLVKQCSAGKRCQQVIQKLSKVSCMKVTSNTELNVSDVLLLCWLIVLNCISTILPGKVFPKMRDVNLSD